MLLDMAPRNRYGRLAVTTYRLLIDPLILPLRPKITRLCASLGADSILDIASGTGAQCRALAEAGLTATGVDLSKEMIELARAKDRRNTQYRQGSALDLPFDDRAFDVSLLVLALHEHTEAERTKMLAEAGRVARTALVIAEYACPRHANWNLAWQTIRFVEQSAGPQHRACFKEFVRGNALAGLCARHRLRPNAACSSHFGTIRLIAVPLEAAGNRPAPSAQANLVGVTGYGNAPY
jgi:SAM-dependent methyltransferase